MSLSKLHLHPMDGVKWPCYGEYLCNACGHKWASNKAWRNFGQQCETCDTLSSKPDAITCQPLFYYVCAICDRVRKAKYNEDGEKCKKCRAFLLPQSFQEYKKARIGIPSMFDNTTGSGGKGKGGHRGDLCEKCKEFGMDCSSHRVARKVSPNQIEMTEPAPLGSRKESRRCWRPPQCRTRVQQTRRDDQEPESSPSDIPCSIV